MAARQQVLAIQAPLESPTLLARWSAGSMRRCAASPAPWKPPLYVSKKSSPGVSESTVLYAFSRLQEGWRGYTMCPMEKSTLRPNWRVFPDERKETA